MDQARIDELRTLAVEWMQTESGPPTGEQLPPGARHYVVPKPLAGAYIAEVVHALTLLQKEAAVLRRVASIGEAVTAEIRQKLDAADKLLREYRSVLDEVR